MGTPRSLMPGRRFIRSTASHPPSSLQRDSTVRSSPTPSWHRRSDGALAPEPIVEVDHAAAETAFVHQFEIHTDPTREEVIAASNQDGRDEPMELVDQTGL